jgi:hypothetical protein
VENTPLQDYFDTAIAIAHRSSALAAGNPPIAQRASMVREDLLRQRESVMPHAGDIAIVVSVVNYIDARMSDLGDALRERTGTVSRPLRSPFRCAKVRRRLDV